MNILAIDASTEACSVALWHNDQVDCLFEISPQQHTQLILPMAASLLQQYHLTMQALSAIAFAQGPGSFTGLRIATGVAQGLALAQNLPLIPISTLAALALAGQQQSPEANLIAPVLDARMQEVYFALYQIHDNKIETIIADSLASPEQASQQLQQAIGGQAWLAAGPGINLLPTSFKQSAKNLQPELYPSAREVALLARQAYEQAAFVTSSEALPNYLRNDIVHKKT